MVYVGSLKESLFCVFEFYNKLTIVCENNYLNLSVYTSTERRASKRVVVVWYVNYLVEKNLISVLYSFSWNQMFTFVQKWNFFFLCTRKFKAKKLFFLMLKVFCYIIDMIFFINAH